MTRHCREFVERVQNKTVADHHVSSMLIDCAYLTGDEEDLRDAVRALGTYLLMLREEEDEERRAPPVYVSDADFKLRRRRR